MMKKLLTVVLAAACFAASAQTEYPYPWNPDADLDGWVSTGDLLELLAVFGGDFAPDSWETDSLSAAVILDGDHSYFKCQSLCNSIEGRWRMADLDAFGRHFSLVENVDANFWIESNDRLTPTDDGADVWLLWAHGATGNFYTESGAYASQANRCLCHIQSSPLLPSLLTDDSNIQLLESVTSLQTQVDSLNSILTSLDTTGLFGIQTTVNELDSLVSMINYGCTDSTACNYSIHAEIDDSTCEGVLGCTDQLSSNFNPSATCDNGSCAPYVGMIGYGGIVFEVNGSNARVLNIGTELFSGHNVNSVYNAVSELNENGGDNGYHDWQVLSGAQWDIVCESMDLLNVFITQEDGIPIAGMCIVGGYIAGGSNSTAYFGCLNASNSCYEQYGSGITTQCPSAATRLFRSFNFD